MTARKYLYEARAGTAPKSGHVVAGSVDEARTMLSASGLSEVVILDDDFLSDLRSAGERDGLKFEADLEVLSRTRPTALAMVGYVLRKNWGLYVVAAAILAIAVYAGLPAWVLALTVLGVAYVVYLAIFPGWVQWRQNEMYRAFWRGDWEASARIAEGLRNLRIIRNVPSTHLEFDSRIASARVMQGRRDEAFELIAPWGASDAVPTTSYLVKAAGLHFLAGEHARVLEVQERILQESGGADHAAIDLALMLARMGEDDERAAALLDGLDPSNRVPLHLGFIAWGRGVLALRRNEVDAAVRELATAVDEMQRHAMNLAMWGPLSLATGYLAVAVARAGRAEAARELFATVRSLVERHGETRLLEWLRAERLLAPAQGKP